MKNNFKSISAFFLMLFLISGFTFVQNDVKQNVAKAETTTSETEEVEITCTDSDSGLDYFTKGKVYGTDSEGEEYKTYDECSGDTLTEYICEDGAWVEKEYECSNGCDDGACIEDEDSYNDYSLLNRTIIKIPGDDNVYVLMNGEKKLISGPEDLEEYGLTSSDVEPFIDLSSDSDEEESEDEDTDAELVRDTTGKVYRIVNGKMIWVPTVAAFNAQGLKWEEVREQVRAQMRYTETRLVKDSEGNIYCITDNGKKMLILDEETLNLYGDEEDIVEVSDEILDSIEDVIAIRSKNGKKVYILQGNKKKWVKNIQAFNRLGLNWDDVEVLNDEEVDAYTEDSSIE